MSQSGKSRKNPEPTIDNPSKIPPQAIDVEEVILGALMVDQSSVPVIMGLLSSPDAFYKEAHRMVFKACQILYDKAEPIDIITVTDELRKQGELDLVGGSYFVTTLTNRVCSGENAEFHCRILIENHVKREIIKASSEINIMSYDDTNDAFDCLTQLDAASIKINEIIASGGSMQSMRSIMPQTRATIEAREKLFKSGQTTGIPTGLKYLNKLTGGWQPSDLIIIAGRPSMGKSALMLHHALSSNVHVNIYSLEMSRGSLAIRLATTVSGIDPHKLRSGALSKADWEAFEMAERELTQSKIHIDDTAVVTTRHIKSHSKLMRDKGLCDLIMVDYLQLLDMRSDQKGRNREQEVAQASRELKIIAKTLGVPVIVISQLSRECEKRGDKKPLLSDLRESGAIEQDADLVVFVYRPEYYKLKNKHGEPIRGIGYEIVAKGRDTGVGEIPFRYNESMTQIHDYDYQSQVDSMPPNRDYSIPSHLEEDPF